MNFIANSLVCIVHTEIFEYNVSCYQNSGIKMKGFFFLDEGSKQCLHLCNGDEFPLACSIVNCNLSTIQTKGSLLTDCHVSEIFCLYFLVQKLHRLQWSYDCLVCC